MKELIAILALGAAGVATVKNPKVAFRINMITTFTFLVMISQELELMYTIPCAYKIATSILSLIMVSLSMASVMAFATKQNKTVSFAQVAMNIALVGILIMTTFNEVALAISTVAFFIANEAMGKED